MPPLPLHYRIDGTDAAAPWLVFCNSLGTDLHMWDAQVADLAGRFRILRYDRRGHGGSEVPPPPYALSDLGEDLLALLDRLGIERVHFCGLSIGGLVGQWLGVNAPDRLDRLVVCATAARLGTPESWAARSADVAAHGLSGLVAATADRWFTRGFAAAHPEIIRPVLDRFAATSVDGYVGCCAALGAADLRDRLPEITAPLLAVSGTDDPVCPPSDLAAIAAGVQRGRHLTLPGRHIVNIESAPAFNLALSAFLKGDG